MALSSQKNEVLQALSRNGYTRPEASIGIQNGVVEEIDLEQLSKLLSSEDPILQRVGFKQLFNSTSLMPDSVLLGLIQSPDPRQSQLGSTLLLERDHDEILRCIEPRCDGPEHAKEVLNEALYGAIKNILSGRYEDRGKPLIAYLIGIAMKIIASYWRTKYKYQYDMVPLDDCERFLRSRSDLVEVQANFRHKLSEAELFLSQLDEPKRTIFKLYVFDGMLAKDVGNQFEKSAENVRKIVSRIRKDLKQHLEQV